MSHVISCLTCLVPHVLSCFTCHVLYVLPCPMCSCVQRASCPTCSRIPWTLYLECCYASRASCPTSSSAPCTSRLMCLVSCVPVSLSALVLYEPFFPYVSLVPHTFRTICANSAFCALEFPSLILLFFC